VSAIENRFAIGQYHMAADTQRGKLVRETDCVVERGPVCHQGRGSDNSLSVSFEDGAVHACSEAEIVGIYD
jgi:hypothetical protein